MLSLLFLSWFSIVGRRRSLNYPPFTRFIMVAIIAIWIWPLTSHTNVRRINMDYEAAYKILFNGITDALTELDKANEKSPEMIRAEMLLQSAQRKTEEMYIEGE